MCPDSLFGAVRNLVCWKRVHLNPSMEIPDPIHERQRYLQTINDRKSLYSDMCQQTHTHKMMLVSTCATHSLETQTHNTKAITFCIGPELLKLLASLGPLQLCCNTAVSSAEARSEYQIKLLLSSRTCPSVRWASNTSTPITHKRLSNQTLGQKFLLMHA